MSKTKRLLAFVLACSLVLATGCDKQESVAPELVDSKYDRVQYREASRHDIGDIVMFCGEIRSKRSYHFTDYDNKLISRVKCGDMVKKGETLAEITLDDSAKEVVTELNNAIESQKNTTKRDNKKLEYANELNELEINHNKTLIEEIKAEEPQRENGKEEIQALKDLNASLNNQIKSNNNTIEYNNKMCDMQVSNLKTKLAKAQGKADERYVKSNIDGQVCYMASQYHAKLVAVVEDLTNLYVTLPANAEDTCSKSKVFAMVDDKMYELSRIYNDSENLSLLVDEGINQPPMYEFQDGIPKDYKSGDRIVIYCIENYKENVIAVYNDSIKNVDTSPYIFVYENGEKVQREVTIGKQTDTMTEIVLGLEEGELVCYDSTTYPPDIVSETYEVKRENVEYKLKFTSANSSPRDRGYQLDLSQSQKLVNIHVEIGDIVEKGQKLFTYSIPGGKAEYAAAENALVEVKKSYELYEKDVKKQKKELNKIIKNAKGYEKQKNKILLKQLEFEYGYTKLEYQAQVEMAKEALKQIDETYFHVPVVAEAKGCVRDMCFDDDNNYLIIDDSLEDLRYDSSESTRITNHSECIITFSDGTTGTGHTSNTYCDGEAKRYYYDELGRENGWFAHSMRSDIVIILDNPEDIEKYDDGTVTEIIRDVYQNVVVIPKKYVMIEDGRNYVWLQMEDGYAKQYIQVGDTNGAGDDKRVIVTEGLEAGQVLAMPE